MVKWTPGGETQEGRKEGRAAKAGWSEGCRPLGDMGSLLLVSGQDPWLLWSLFSTSLLSTGLPLMGICPWGRMHIWFSAIYSSSCNFQWERENKKVIDICFCLDQSNIGKREEGKGLEHTRIDFALSLRVVPFIYSFNEYLLNAHHAAGSILGLSRRNEPVREGLSFHRAIFWWRQIVINLKTNKNDAGEGDEAGRGKTLEAHFWLALVSGRGRTVISDQSPEGYEGSVPWRAEESGSRLRGRQVQRPWERKDHPLFCWRGSKKPWWAKGPWGAYRWGWKSPQSRLSTWLGFLSRVQE